MTPTMIAVSNGNVNIFDLLISKGCDVWAKDKVVYSSKKIYSGMEIKYLQCGHGLLVVAVWGEKVDLFKKVLRMGFDVNETCSVRSK